MGKLGQYQKAENALKQALILAPFNSKYLKEQGFLLMQRKAWSEALTVLKLAEEHLNFRPAQEAVALQPVVLRSNGVALIELNRLEDAKTYFKQALALNPQDKKALDELEYIRQLEKSNANQ